MAHDRSDPFQGTLGRMMLELLPPAGRQAPAWERAPWERASATVNRVPARGAGLA